MSLNFTYFGSNNIKNSHSSQSIFPTEKTHRFSLDVFYLDVLYLDVFYLDVLYLDVFYQVRSEPPAETVFLPGASSRSLSV